MTLGILVTLGIFVPSTRRWRHTVLFCRPGSSSQPIWLQTFSCGYTSDSCLNLCASCPSRSITSCTHSRDVTVQCGESRKLNLCRGTIMHINIHYIMYHFLLYDYWNFPQRQQVVTGTSVLLTRRGGGGHCPKPLVVQEGPQTALNSFKQDLVKLVHHLRPSLASL